MASSVDDAVRVVLEDDVEKGEVGQGKAAGEEGTPAVQPGDGEGLAFAFDVEPDVPAVQAHGGVVDVDHGVAVHAADKQDVDVQGGADDAGGIYPDAVPAGEPYADDAEEGGDGF